MGEMSGRSARQSGWGVITLTMGSPSSPEEVQPYLERLFGDPALLQAPLGPLRPVLARLLARLRAPRAAQRYGLVGGSRLIPESLAQTSALERELAPDAIPFALGATYLAPEIDEALDRLTRRGARQILALPLFPQYSHTTTGAALGRLDRAATRLGLPVRAIRAYPTLPGLVETLTAMTREALDHPGQQPAAVLLTAHGLPERYVRSGDPYVDQVQETATAVRTRLEVDCPVALGFQSRLGPLRWVGPTVETEVERLAHLGTRRLVVVPISFVSEHLETSYDLDLALKGLAWRAGIRNYQRVATVGDHPAFIRDLAGLVRAQVEADQ